MKQFSKVDCSRGAPMGRAGYGVAPARKVRCFKVRLDSGGYDDGGAYWGVDYSGKSLYCIQDRDFFRRFTRASSRADAANQCGMSDFLKRGAQC